MIKIQIIVYNFFNIFFNITSFSKIKIKILFIYSYITFANYIIY